MPRGFGPPPSHINQKYKTPKPKTVKEVPKYLKTVISVFFSHLFYIFKIVWETKPFIMIGMMVTALVRGVMPVANAYIVAEILNALAATVTGHSDFSRVMALLIALFVYLFINQLVVQSDAILTRISGELITNHIRMKIMHKAKSVDVGSFDLPDFYERLENANREAGMRPLQIMNATFSVTSSIITLVSFIAILLAVSPFAPFLVMAVSIPSAIINFIYRNKTVHYMRFHSKERRQMTYYSDTVVNKDIVKEVRLFGLADLFINSYKSVFKKYFKGYKRLIFHEGFWQMALAILSIIVNFLLYVFIAKGVSEGRMQLGDFSLYTGALTSISSGIANLISYTATIYEGTLFIDNLILFMNEKQTVVPLVSDGIAVKRHQGHVFEFKNVSFKYPGTDRLVIKNVNLKINEGETLVLVGLNGAGKTTLLKLLMRIYDPSDGEILLDGKNIKEYNVAELYSIFGSIFQDFGKYAMTIKENIMFGQADKPIDEERIVTAAKQSNSDVFIEKLPRKYDTPLMRFFEEDGIELSIGQWQKLSIARAFYRDADILILDEPTASLDAIAEQEIFNQFESLRKGKTTIFVSHRLSSATTASKIVVLEYGEIIEEGTHRKLMEKKGKYYELFSTQAKRYIDTDDGQPPKLK